MNGVIIVNKPIGITSQDVVTEIRKSMKIKSVGHTGTLDPLASGVLPILISIILYYCRFMQITV